MVRSPRDQRESGYHNGHPFAANPDQPTAVVNGQIAGCCDRSEVLADQQAAVAGWAQTGATMPSMVFVVGRSLTTKLLL